IARVQGLVLHRNGVNANAVLLHALDVLHEVLRVGTVKLRLERAALALAVGLHPSGRAPGRP
nr:hypothetical protein [Tanacetum cinerariifolium]